MSDQDAPTPRGILDPQAGSQRFRLWLRHPGAALAEIVEHYWAVRWELPEGEEYPQHNLAHPCTHLVAENDGSYIQGLVTGRFTKVLRGNGGAAAIKFRPAGFRPFFGRRMTELADRRMPVGDVFGRDGEAFAGHLLALDDIDAVVEAAEAFLTQRMPAADPDLAMLNRVVAQIQADRSITRVETVATLAGVGTRTLQRQFADAIGVSPKWVIKRFRLQDAADRLSADEHVDLAALALELGYFDQAHLARDFRAIVGRPPAAYARGKT